MDSNVTASVKDGMVLLTDGQTTWGFEPDRAKQLAHVLYAMAPRARVTNEEDRTVSVPAITGRPVNDG